MRAIMARLRGPMAGIEDPERRDYEEAGAEAYKMCQNLGLDVPDPFAEVGDLVRLAYAQGWLACESRLASPDMADSIAQAIGDPGSILERNVDESIPGWSVRAVQHAVAYGVPKAGA